MRGQLVVALLLVGLTSSVRAQSQQHWSIQGSGALVFPTAEESEFENSTRLGWEAQVRYTFSRFSLGAGYQRSTVYQFSTGDFSAAVSVVFAEPRYVVLAGSRAALYLAGRVGMSTLVCSPEEDCAEQGGHFAGGGSAHAVADDKQPLFGFREKRVFVDLAHPADAGRRANPEPH